MVSPKQKKIQAGKGTRILISVNVIGSAGPIRLVVNTEELVATVVDSILRTYARAGRLPILGTNTDDFYLSAGGEVMQPCDTIGSHGVWNFFLWKKPKVEKFTGDESPVTPVVSLNQKGHGLSKKPGHGNWRAWFSKSLKISSH